MTTRQIRPDARSPRMIRAEATIEAKVRNLLDCEPRLLTAFLAGGAVTGLGRAMGVARAVRVDIVEDRPAQAPDESTPPAAEPPDPGPDAAGGRRPGD